jgi:hypothetical protein
MTRHAVALVPRFLGFSHLGRWPIALLPRCAGKSRRENFAAIPVVPVSRSSGRHEHCQSDQLTRCLTRGG